VGKGLIDLNSAPEKETQPADVGRRKAGALAVYGGPGIEEVAGFNQAYHLDQGYRTTHHSDRVMPAATWPMIPRRVSSRANRRLRRIAPASCSRRAGPRITAMEVDHAPIAPAYAYRFDYKGRSVVIIGDLKYHAPLATAARGADVLVSEAIVPSMTQALGKGASASQSRNARASGRGHEDPGPLTRIHVRLQARGHAVSTKK
jgi:ribonuclease BN (tRNA processing enzyme)